MGTINARVIDSTHLELSSPVDIPAGESVQISLLQKGQGGKEKDEWAELSLGGLAASYDEAEPEYPSYLVKEQNPEYGNERG